MKSPRLASRLFSAVLLCALFFSLPASLAGQEEEIESKRVVFLPFSIHASPDLAYLGEGIRSILASRLAAEGDLVVTSNALVAGILQNREVTPAIREEIYRQLDADYLVSGTLTALAGSFRLDAAVYEQGTKEPLVQAYTSADREEDVLKAVDQLAWEIGGRVFGIRKQVTVDTAGQPERVRPQIPPRPSPFRTAHPEKAFLDQERGPGSGAGESTGGDAGQWSQDPAGGLGMSSKFDFSLQAFAAGDLTGDGQTEFVLASRQKIFVYRPNSGRLEEIASLSVAAPHSVHWLSLADLDGNGAQELYISAASASGPRSLALVWEGGGFRALFESAPWYIRAMELPGEGPVLLAQAHDNGKVLRPGIQRLRQAEGLPLQAEPLNLPGWINIFDFAMADVTGDGQPEIIHIDQKDSLVLSQLDGTILWRSSESYGGSKRLLGGEANAATQQNYYEPGYVEAPRYYVPARILTVDLNGNGIAEVLLNRNHAKAVPLLGKLRNYASGELSALSWKGGELARVWQSRKLDGYIVDFLLQPGPDGNLLQVGVELEGEGLLTKAISRESTIISLSLP
jgi:hypothetical protein